MFYEPQYPRLLALDVRGGSVTSSALTPGFGSVWPRSTGDYHVGVQPVTGTVAVQIGRCVDTDARGLGPCGLVYRDSRAAASFLFDGDARAAPRISPDGRLIAMRTLYGDIPSIELVNSAGTGLGRYPAEVRAVRWLPNNRLVMLTEDGRTVRLTEPVPSERELDGIRVTRRVTLNADDGGRAYAMDVSPDGRTLAYVWVVNAGGSTRRGEVRLLDLQSSSIRRVAATPDFVAGDLVSGLLRIYNLWNIGWRHDGRAVFVGIGGSNRTVGPAGSGALLEVSTTGSGVLSLNTGDRDLRDGLQYPATAGVVPLRHGGHGDAPGDPAPDLPAGLWPYTDYQWIAR